MLIGWAFTCADGAVFFWIATRAVVLTLSLTGAVVVVFAVFEPCTMLFRGCAAGPADAPVVLPKAGCLPITGTEPQAALALELAEAVIAVAVEAVTRAARGTVAVTFFTAGLAVAAAGLLASAGTCLVLLTEVAGLPVLGFAYLAGTTVDDTGCGIEVRLVLAPAPAPARVPLTAPFAILPVSFFMLVHNDLGS